MRRGLVAVIVVLLVVVVVCVAEYQFNWPFVLSPNQSMASSGSAPNTDAARYSNVRGLQDAPRDDVALGTVLDMSHCLNTMNLRGLRPDEAHHTCEQLIAGISKIY